MARKLRVYELARHYGVDSKAITVLLQKMRVEVKSHMSVVEDEFVDKIHAIHERKRELARLNYAEAHKLDPDKLKHVASLKPLERPQPPPEPKKIKKVKKKAAKKKPTKAKVVIIKKAGQETAVVKKAAAKKEAAKKAAARKAEAEKEKRETRDAELAASRDKFKQARMVKKLVKKAPRLDPEASELPAEPVAVAEPVDDATASVASSRKVETKSETVVASAAAGTAPTAEAAPTEPGSESVTETAPADETTAEAASTAVPAAAEAPITETEAVTTEPAAQEAKPEVRGGRPERPRRGAKIIKRGQGVPKEVKESVKESVKAAIRKRKDEAAAKAEVSPRRKRQRQRKRKVDEVAVERQLKQTMAQLETGQTRRKRKKGGPVEVVEEVPNDILQVTEFITVQELAEKLEVPAKDIITKLFTLGQMVTINQRLEREHIELLAEEFERELEFLSEYGEEMLEQDEVKAEDLRQRPPVVTVMGHVDHGKTSLLDHIRETNVIAGEAGGITQHIGAYMVQTPGGPITFLDTPGHAAFTAMRARGAQVTDIVILVVAADDRVMPQTIEAINHAKAAGVPVIVAINKIDLPAANPDLVKQELLNHEIHIEEYGGDILCAEISAKKGINIEKLLELVHLQAEVLELTASPEGGARGVVIEATKEQGRGVIFTVLVDQGTLKKGDIFLVGVRDGRVRAIFNERGEPLESVNPGEPAVILGAHDVPEAGDRFYVLDSERDAREIATKRRSLQRQQQLVGPKKKIDLDNLAEMIVAQDLKELPIIVKGDVAGSVEALCDQLLELNTEEVAIKIMHKAVGAVSESDVLLAGNIGALIIGFHLRPGPTISELAKSHHVTIEVFDVIYEAVDTLRKAMAGLLSAIQREVSTGSAEVRQVFRIPKLGTVAGSMVTNGKIMRNSRVRLIREEMVVFEGKIHSLKRFKEDAKEVQSGYECGIGLENFHDLSEGDLIEAYEIEEITRTEL
ncbi:MAG: translation initiation factor IF-2 [bacterium]